MLKIELKQNIYLASIFQLARAKDQLLPLLVMDILGDYPGLPGLFVAGVFSAALRLTKPSFHSKTVFSTFIPYFSVLSQLASIQCPQ